MVQLINEAKRFQKLANIKEAPDKPSSLYDKKWEAVGAGQKGEPYGDTWYKTFITPEMKEKIKKDLGISDDDIEITHDEMQEDRSMWFTNVKINTNALPDDKKSNYRTIVQNIIRPVEEKSTEQKAPNDAPVIKKSGIIDKIKSFFGKKQQESLDIDTIVNEALAKVRKTGK